MLPKKEIAIIGCGYWGKNLIRVFYSLGVLNSICDSDHNTLTQLAIDYPEVKATGNYKTILKNKSIKAVVIATPAEGHYRLTKESLLSGKDVFVEKPLSLTVEEGRELVEIAKRNSLILMVGHLLEYHPAVKKIKELIQKGELGRIQYISSNRLNLGRIRREENILWSFAPHDISVILYILESMPEQVSAFGGNYLNQDIADVTISNLSFPNGVKGHIYVSWLHPFKEQKLVVVGSKGMIVFDDVVEKNKLRIFNHKIKWVNRLHISEKMNPVSIGFSTEEPLFLECEHFLNCIKSRKMPQTDGRSALRVLSVLQSCQLSLERGGTVVTMNEITKRVPKMNDFFAHPTAIVDQPYNIGKGTKIWHYSHVMPGAKIGKHCRIGQSVFIGSKAQLGNSVKVQNNVSIYDCVKLEDGVFCGPSVVFTNVINPRSNVERKNEYKKTLVKQGATIGANATVICGHTIGEYAFIGAGSVVTKDIPSYALCYGNPAVPKGWMCKCGVKLNFVRNQAKCKACGVKFKLKHNQLVEQ